MGEFCALPAGCGGMPTVPARGGPAVIEGDTSGGREDDEDHGREADPREDLVVEEQAARDRPAEGRERAEGGADPGMPLPQERVRGEERPVVAGELERDRDDPEAEDRRRPLLLAADGEREEQREGADAGREREAPRLEGTPARLLP